MSKDGYLPDDVREADFDRAFPSNDHVSSCPAGEDGPTLFSECGGVGRCVCFPDNVHGRINLFWHGPCAAVVEPDCICPNEAEERAEAAEAEYDRRRDR